jgi:Spy/CpxP family protein refolding chaperone
MSLRNCLAASAAAILLGAAAAAIAQDATTNPSPAPRMTHNHIVAPFNQLTDLTDDQKSKIRDIHSDILQQEKELRQKEHDEINAILTDDQKKELDDLSSKSSMEKKESEMERRAKEEEDKASSLKDKIDGGATTQPAAGQ